MKGHIKITARPCGHKVETRCKISLTGVNALGKKILLKVFLKGIELSTDAARVLLDVIDKEASHERTE